MKCANAGGKSYLDCIDIGYPFISSNAAIESSFSFSSSCVVRLQVRDFPSASVGEVLQARAGDAHGRLERQEVPNAEGALWWHVVGSWLLFGR